jgi:hypothetical protein
MVSFCSNRVREVSELKIREMNLKFPFETTWKYSAKVLTQQKPSKFSYQNESSFVSEIAFPVLLNTESTSDSISKTQNLMSFRKNVIFLIYHFGNI